MKRLVALAAILFFILGCGGSKTEKTEVEMHQALQNDATDYYTEGLKFIEKAAVPEAVQSFQKAIRKNPNDIRAYLILGEVNMRLKNYQGAIDTLKASLNVDPNNGGAYYLLAVSTGLKGDREEAVKYAQRSAVIFKDKKDEENLKKSLTLVQGLSGAGPIPTQP